MTRSWSTPSVVAEALFVSIVAGERLCSTYAGLEGDHREATALRTFPRQSRR